MRVKYSCVVDNRERYQKQGWIWLNSLIYFGKIDPADIFVHCVAGTDDGFARKCAEAGANVEITEPYGDKTYCNKIAQMGNPRLKDSDAVILMDCDMIMLRNFEDTIDFTRVSAKIINYANPETHILDSLFALAGLEKSSAAPDVKIEYADDYFTYGANFNGGLYIIPARFYGVVESGWQKWALWLLEYGKPLYDAGSQTHIDQISFCMAVHENNIPVNHLHRRYNYSTPRDFGDGEPYPYVLHYHTYTDENNLVALDYAPAGNIKIAVETANGFISGL